MKMTLGEFNLDFVLNLPVFEVLLIIVLAILVDTIFGIILAVHQGNFSWQELPRFLGTNVLPYVLGLIILSLVAEYQGEPFSYIFYPTALAVLIRYIAKVNEKIKQLFGIQTDQQR